jgi:hypothetical protein
VLQIYNPRTAHLPRLSTYLSAKSSTVLESALGDAQAPPSPTDSFKQSLSMQSRALSMPTPPSKQMPSAAALAAQQRRTTMSLMVDPENAQGDAAIAEEIARTLRTTFHQVLGASLAAAPRPLGQTLKVALAYGIQIDNEPHYLWLADLALSLPLPAGWVQVSHEGEQKSFWHNEICGSSQWRHPVDDFITQTIKMQRAPSSRQVQVMRRSRNPRKRRGALQRTSISSLAGTSPSASQDPSFNNGDASTANVVEQMMVGRGRRSFDQR